MIAMAGIPYQPAMLDGALAEGISAEIKTSPGCPLPVSDVASQMPLTPRIQNRYGRLTDGTISAEIKRERG